MKTPPSDDEIDRLLARGYRDTSPEFEARWVALKRDLRQRPALASRRAWWNTVWLVALGALAAVLFLIFARPAPVPELTPQLSEMLALESALSPARPLLDEETRAALLHLAPAETHPE